MASLRWCCCLWWWQRWWRRIHDQNNLIENSEEELVVVKGGAGGEANEKVVRESKILFLEFKFQCESFWIYDDIMKCCANRKVFVCICNIARQFLIVEVEYISPGCRADSEIWWHGFGWSIGKARISVNLQTHDFWDKFCMFKVYTKVSPQCGLPDRNLCWRWGKRSRTRGSRPEWSAGWSWSSWYQRWCQPWSPWPAVWWAAW